MSSLRIEYDGMVLFDGDINEVAFEESADRVKVSARKNRRDYLTGVSVGPGGSGHGGGSMWPGGSGGQSAAATPGFGGGAAQGSAQ